MANAAAAAATATSTVGTEHTAMANEAGMTAAETAVAAMRQELQQSTNFYY